MAISIKTINAVEEELNSLKAQVKPILAEIEKLEKFLTSLKSESHEPPRKLTSPSKLDYPMESSLFEKLRYLEDEYGRFWKSEDMRAKIIELEGKKEGDKTIHYFSQRLQHLITKKEVVCVKYNKSRINSFFTTHPELIDKDYHSKGKHRIKPGHEPEDKYLKKMSEEQLDPSKMEWTKF